MTKTLPILTLVRLRVIASVLLIVSVAVALAGCNKQSAEETAPGTQAAGTPVPSASIAPEVQAQIDAKQKADAARIEDMAKRANGGAAQ